MLEPGLSPRVRSGCGRLCAMAKVSGDTPWITLVNTDSINTTLTPHVRLKNIYDVANVVVDSRNCVVPYFSTYLSR